MPEPLVSARAKVERAEIHLEAAVEAMRKYSRDDCGAEPKLDDEGQYVNVVARVPAPPPIIGLLIGDCVHNLRSALDHAVFEMILWNVTRPENTPDDKVQFPICTAIKGFDNQLRRGRLRGLSEDATALVKGLQPYHGREQGRDPNTHLLEVLGKLDNIDKHRRLALTVGVGFRTRIRMTDAAGMDVDVVAHEPVHDSAILTRFPRPTQHDVEVDGRLASQIIFNEGAEVPGLLNANVGDTLQRVTNHVRDVVLPALESLG